MVVPSLGRNLAGGGAANVTVNLVQVARCMAIGSMRPTRAWQKILHFGRTRTNVGVDVYNAFNSSHVYGYNLTFGPRWLTPTSVLPARFARVGAQIDF